MTMRTPTPKDRLFAWWRQAVAEPYLIDAVPQEPQAGFYKRRLVQGGVFVPARIWVDAEIDIGTGELLGPETLFCEVDGHRRDADDEWSWICSHPISESEFNYLTQMRRHAQQHEPDLPFANPKRPVDWLKAPLPTFKKETHQ